MVVLLGLLVYFVENIARLLLPVGFGAWDYAWATAIAAGLIGLSFWLSYDRISRQVSATALTFDAGIITDRPCLICGYSPVDEAGEDGLPPASGPFAVNLDMFGNNLEKACSTDKASYLAFGPWQQNLRVLKKMTNVENLYVINPNKDQFVRFREVICHFFPKLTVELVTHKDGGTTFKRNFHDPGVAPDYENFEYVTMGIGWGIEMIAKGRKLCVDDAEQLTVLDVTGGFKTFSIAAAIASLNRRLLFVYAGTYERTGQVIGFDVSIQLFEAGKM